MSDTNFPHKLLLTNTQLSNLHKAFPNNSLVNMKLSKTQLHKIGQSGGFFGKLFLTITKSWFALNEKCT